MIKKGSANNVTERRYSAILDWRKNTRNASVRYFGETCDNFTGLRGHFLLLNSKSVVEEVLLK